MFGMPPFLVGRRFGSSFFIVNSKDCFAHLFVPCNEMSTLKRLLLPMSTQDPSCEYIGSQGNYGVDV